MLFRLLIGCLLCGSSLLSALTCSLIIPCHHTHFQHLGELLRKCTFSSRLPDEVIISLSGCAQIPADQLEELQSQSYPFPVRFLCHQESVSRGGNRNRAAAVAQMDVLVCQDADDLPHCERIQICMETLETHPELQMVLHGCAMPQESRQLGRYVWRVPSGVFETARYSHKQIPFFKYPKDKLPKDHHCFCNGVPVLKKAVWEQGIRWIETLQRTEDVKFVRQILRRYPGQACFINLPLYYYRIALSAGYGSQSIWMPEDQDPAA